MIWEYCKVVQFFVYIWRAYCTMHGLYGKYGCVTALSIRYSLVCFVTARPLVSKYFAITFHVYMGWLVVSAKSLLVDCRSCTVRFILVSALKWLVKIAIKPMCVCVCVCVWRWLQLGGVCFANTCVWNTAKRTCCFGWRSRSWGASRTIVEWWSKSGSFTRTSSPSCLPGRWVDEQLYGGGRANIIRARRRFVTCSWLAWSSGTLYAAVYYVTPIRVQNIVIGLFVCLSVRSHISKNTSKNTSKFHKIFCTCYTWPWLDPPMMALRYVMYFRFCEWRHVLI